MSPYNDAIFAYAHAKSVVDANKAAAASTSTASSGASVYSGTSSYYPVKDNTYKATMSSPKSKSKSIKAWTKNLVSDIGKPPTFRYDAAHNKDSKLYGTNAIGAPYWDSRPTKI